MNLFVSKLCFSGKPENYAYIDSYISRSAQPKKEDFKWLKDNGVTDVFNFRTMRKPEIDFDEEKVVKSLGMNYHSIPSVTSRPKKKNVERFLNEINEVKLRGGKAHIHCKAGADRTGMYAFIYKMKMGLGTLKSNKEEWLARGMHYHYYPNLMSWAEHFVKRFILK